MDNNESSWPSKSEMNEIRRIVSEMAGKPTHHVRIVVSPYRICPLGAHIDHQGGTVSAMTINKGILLGFIPSYHPKVLLRSGQFTGEVSFRVDEIQHPKHMIKKKECQLNNTAEDDWGTYARGAVYALQSRGNNLTKGIIGYICGSVGMDSSGLSSSAAVGVAYLLALEKANNLAVSPTENIEYDRLIENEYLGLRNGILDQSAILLSSIGCLTCMNCKTKEYKLIKQASTQNGQKSELQKTYKILLVFSGLRQCLTTNPGYNNRVAECQEAAKFLLCASGNSGVEAVLSNVDPKVYATHKDKLPANLAKRAEHYFSENERVLKGLDAWAAGKMEEFGKLISASGLSSIRNYECGSEPLIQLYEVLLRAPGVLGARFSGAGFRGCCLAIVEATRAEEATAFVKEEYYKLQPELASHINKTAAFVICEADHSARVI
ncbi:hypothetical protein ACFE04_026991 [Oxalis oulophora]